MKVWAIILMTVFIGNVQADTSINSGTPNICLSTCVNLKKPAIRVVALNWTATEMLLSLGVKPVGVTQVKGYRKWQTNHPALAEDVPEVGRRQEPNLAEIAKLKPDLIIGYDFRHQRLYKALSSIAPTLLYQQFPRVDQGEFRYFDQAQLVFKQIAKVTNRTKKADQLLTEMQQTLRLLREQLASHDMSGKSVAYGKFVGMGYGLRMFSDSSLAGSVASELGLNYHWHTALPGKDFVHLQLEQLPDIKDTYLLLAGNQTDSERMTQSPVWNYLPFVTNNSLSQVEPLWSFGGPVSIVRMAKAFTDSLLNPQEVPHA